MKDLSAKLYRPGCMHATATAWLVSDEYVLTAYHCILDDANRRYADYERFQLEFDSGEKVQAVVVEGNSEVDAAVLHIVDHPFTTDGKITFGFLPGNEVWAKLAASKKHWTGWGYPQGRPEGLLVEGTIALPSAPYWKGTAIQLTCDQAGARGEPLKGMSGAAVVHDQALVGIIRSAPKELDQHVIYATPIGHIADALRTVDAILRTHYQRELNRMDRDSDASSAIAWRTAGSMNIAAEGITHRSNVVYKSTKLYGRQEQVIDLRRSIEEGARLVTLYGPDGCGKTRLAHAVGKAFLDRYDGVFAADLFTCEDAASALTEIANTLGVREAHDNLLEESLTVVIGERDVLLILDGAERLAEWRGLIDNLLDNCPKLRIMAVRRHPLQWEGREEYASLVDPLPLHLEKQGADLLREYTKSFALPIFQDQAKRTNPAFQLDITNIDLVAALCRPTGGVPLAIEIVAGHAGPAIAESPNVYAALTKIRSFEEALREIGKLPQEERLDAIIKLAADQLEADTRSLFLRLSAFAGGCTVEAAEFVGSDLACMREDIGNKLELLVGRGLLWPGLGIKGKPYYRLQPAVLAYCRRNLTDKRNEARMISRRQVAYYAQLAMKAERRLTLLSSDELIDWFELLEFEYVNLRNALACADSDPADTEQIDIGLGIVGNLFWFWNLRGSLVEGIRWCARLLSKSTIRTRNRGAALYCSGGLSYLRGDFKEAREQLTESVTIWEELEDQRRRGFTLVLLGAVALYQNRLVEAKRTEELAKKLFERLDDRAGFALALNDLANVMMELDKTQAHRHYLDSLEIWEELRNYWGVGLSISNLGRLACAEKRYKEANARLVDALRIQSRNRYQWGHAESLKFMGYTLLGVDNLGGATKEFRDSFIAHQRLGRKHLVADCLDGLAKVAIKLQRPLIAAYLFGAASGLREQSTQTPTPHENAELEIGKAIALAAVEQPERFYEELEAGKRATFAEISRKTVAYAEQMIAESSSAPPHVS